MNINQLLHPGNPKEVYSNGDAKVTRVAPIDAEFRAEEIPSVVYHGSGGDLPDTDGHVVDKIYKVSTESHEAVKARFMEMMTLLSSGLSHASADLKRSYDVAMELLPTDLRDKDWGFSVSEGSLTFSEGENSLSDQEQSMLKDAFSQAGVGYYAEKVAATMIRALELDRGPAGVSNGIGRFDVSRSNFDEVVDLRTYLKVHEPGGGYDLNTKDPEDFEHLFALGGRAMMDQISAKADETYTKPADFGLIYL